MDNIICDFNKPELSNCFSINQLVGQLKNYFKESNWNLSKTAIVLNLKVDSFRY